MKAILSGVVLACLSLMGAQWGMGPGPGTAHAVALNPCSTNIGDDVIHYVVATYDGSGVAAGVKLYVDGTLETMTTDKDTFTGSAANAIPLIAGQRSDGTSPLSGPMAFAEVYNCVLTPTQIAAYHTAGPGIY